MGSRLSPPTPHEAAGQRVEVRCYSGFKADERPLSFTLCGRELSVMAIESGWFEEDAAEPGRRACFRVRTDDGGLYLLSRDEGSGEWTLRRACRPGSAT